MAANLDGVLGNSIQANIKSSKVLVVGAGGIGCELLKNLILTGFRDIEIIDLDTIDVSNLNRQFLFRKEHIGMSKAKIAKEIAGRLNESANIKAHHDSITNSDYGVPFYKQFTLVMNALDNKSARNHVNRMCLAADIPLIESGTAGYLGQGVTECYECLPKTREKTFPGCTIRNTPSEPIHCIVWAKHLFNQLFGEEDADEDVSPDAADPNAVGEQNHKKNTGNIDRISTRAWALFHDDIHYLLRMDKLWKSRCAPVPLNWNNLPDAVACSSKTEMNNEIRDQRIWSIKECAEVFEKAVRDLKESIENLKEGKHLVWDKDNDVIMDFVVACSNIRAHVFGIAQNSRFNIKSMAGNIIPAIATTNAIIAGLIVIEAMKIVEGKLKDCKMVFLTKRPHLKKKYILATNKLSAPNPSCIVCSSKPEVTVKLNTSSFTVKMLEEKIVKGTILISSEEGETTANNEKFLSDFNIKDGSRLKCDDFVQNYQLVLNIVHADRLEEDNEFEVISRTEDAQPKPECSQSKKITNGTEAMQETIDDDDDLMLVQNYPSGNEESGQKREREGKCDLSEPSPKRIKIFK
uniref:SUMO-activating enzyme subunit n=1 Tax=Strigamia maritima TaxID=126957 RepID=T1J2C4_STRMM